MDELSFLPQWPLHKTELLLFASLLVIGFCAGAMMRRLRGPRVLAYLLVGIMLGDAGLGWIDAEVREQMSLLIEAGLGLLLFQLGQRLDLAWLRRERWLWITSASEIALCWLLVFGGMVLFGFARLDAALLAGVAICTSPVIVMALVRETGADGQVTQRVLSLAALNSLASFILLAMLLAAVHLEYSGNWMRMVLHPLYLLAGSFLLGGVVFGAHLLLARWLGKDSISQFALAIGVILFAVGSAAVLKLSILCTLLVLGVLTRNADRARVIRHIDFGAGMELFFITLFISAGAATRVPLDPMIWSAALVLIALRFVSKAVPVYAYAGFTPLGLRRAGYVSLGLTPLSGFAALLVIDSSRAYPQLNVAVLDVIMIAVLVLELAGTLLAHHALKHSDEARPADAAPGPTPP